MGRNDKHTTTPIQHVIIIVGENRSFDHLFATYKPRSGDKVWNILSEGIITAQGQPGPRFAHAVQNRALDNTTYMINPLITGPYRTVPPTNLNFTPNQQTSNNPPFISTSVAAQYDYGLLPDDLVTLTTGASGLPYQTIDTRITNVLNLNSGPYTLDPGGQFGPIRQQSGAPFLPDVPTARLQRCLRHPRQSQRLPRGPVPVGRSYYRRWKQRQTSTTKLH
jgi:phospholipase C